MVNKNHNYRSLRNNKNEHVVYQYLIQCDQDWKQETKL